MRRHVLLVEDDSDARELLTMLLEAHGLNIQSVGSTAAAREVLSERGIDLVLADLFLGTREESSAWRSVDELVALAHPAPVGVISAWAIAPGVARAHGAAFYLHKPVSSADVLGAVATALDLPPLSPDDEGCLRAYFQALEHKDWDALAACCADDVVYHLSNPDPVFGVRVSGRAAFAAYSARTFNDFPNARFAIGSIRPLPRGAIVEYAGSWIAADGNRQTSPGSVLFHLEGGKIAEVGVRLDLSQVLAQFRERMSASGASA